ncbi:MAG: hypothetical protein WCH57_09405 [Verrucomicrobiota bacterium]
MILLTAGAFYNFLIAHHSCFSALREIEWVGNRHWRAWHSPVFQVFDGLGTLESGTSADVPHLPTPSKKPLKITKSQNLQDNFNLNGE